MEHPQPVRVRVREWALHDNFTLLKDARREGKPIGLRQGHLEGLQECRQWVRGRMPNQPELAFPPGGDKDGAKADRQHQMEEEEAIALEGNRHAEGKGKQEGQQPLDNQ